MGRFQKYAGFVSTVVPCLWMEDGKRHQQHLPAELLFPLGLNVFLGPEQKSQEEKKKKKSLCNIDMNWKVIHEISRIHR